MQKFFGRREKVVEYRHSLRGHSRYFGDYDNYTINGLTYSRHKAEAAAQQDIDDYYENINPRYHKKPVKQQHSKPIVVGQHPVMMPLFVVIKGANMTHWQRNLNTMRLRDIGKLRRTLPSTIFVPAN